jgi:N-acetylmuramoyl-L-alanine amidase
VRPIHTIIVHCSATPPDWMEGQGVEAQLAEIRRWHQARGWRREGYHFLIGRDGKIAKGRPIEEVGAHVKGHNTGSIGVCLVGGKWPQGAWGVKTDKFSDHFTPEQDRALRWLLTDLGEQFPSVKHIRGHNDYTDSKGCPSFEVSDWLKAEPTVTPTPKANWGIAGLIVLAFAWLIGRKK